MSLAEERMPRPSGLGDAPQFLVMLASSANEATVSSAPAASAGGSIEAATTGNLVVSDAA